MMRTPAFSLLLIRIDHATGGGGELPFPNKILKWYRAALRCAMMDTDLVLRIPASIRDLPGSRRVRSVIGNENFPIVFGPESMKTLTIGAAKRMAPTTQKNIRFTSEQWKRVEKEAIEREISPNRLVVELAMEALERREWPRTEAEIHLLRSAMFTAQAIIRDMEKAGREDEIEQISKNISEVAPELPDRLANNPQDLADSRNDNP